MDLLEKLTQHIENEVTTALFHRSLVVPVNNIKTEIIYSENREDYAVFAYQIGGTPTGYLVSPADGNIGGRFNLKHLSGNSNFSFVAEVIASKMEVDKRLFIYLSLKKYDYEMIIGVADQLVDIHNTNRSS